MPGHVKLGKPGEPDPDPDPYLVVTMEMKRDAANIPYDPKKSYYYKDEKGDFKECMLESVDGGKATVMCGHEVNFKSYHPTKIFPINNQLDEFDDIISYFPLFLIRKKSTKLKKLVKSIQGSLKDARTWLI